MFKRSLILIQLIVVFQLASANFFFSKGPAKQINDYLVKKLPNSEDVGENLEVARKWLEELRLDSKADKKLVKSLDTFVSLDDVKTDNQCNADTYQIVYKNGQLVDFKSFDANNKYPRRIEQIIRAVGRQVAESCHDKHKGVLEKRLATLDSDKLNQAKRLLEMDKGVIHSQMQNDVCSVRNADMLRAKTFTKLILAIVQGLYEDWEKKGADKDSDLQYLRMITNKETGEKTMNEAKVIEVANKYIIDSCSYFNSNLSDLARMAFLDNTFMKPYSKRWIVDTKSPFDEIVSNFCLCRLFQEKGRAVVAKRAVLVVPIASD